MGFEPRDFEFDPVNQIRVVPQGERFIFRTRFAKLKVKHKSGGEDGIRTHVRLLT